MPRNIRRTTDPEALALAVRALRGALEPAATRSGIDQQLAAALAGVEISPKVAARMLARVDRVRGSVRRRALPTVDAIRPRAPRLDTADGGGVTGFPGLVGRISGRFGDKAEIGPIGPVARSPRYTVTYEGLHCLDETGIDWLGSDEPYVVTSAVHITTGARTWCAPSCIRSGRAASATTRTWTRTRPGWGRGRRAGPAPTTSSSTGCR
ncbi:hypothetical protein [Paraoerskovia sediminicola]|uniref:hypothetical protein n=1 Tax=Paraoerskovia sediminicola TaxID=1138587 RepID=UPI002573A650|nr:hypothetical protein [Paraoerskovia sediminicola]